MIYSPDSEFKRAALVKVLCKIKKHSVENLNFWSVGGERFVLCKGEGTTIKNYVIPNDSERTCTPLHIV